MTPSQYKRLFIVIFIPLLLLGVALSFFIPFNRDPVALCSQSFNIENCRFMGERNDNYYTSALSKSPAWFDINIPGNLNSFVRPFFQGSQRTLSDVQIVHVNPFIGNTQSVEQFIGMSALVQLGISKDERSALTDHKLLLRCNSLDINSTGETYSSLCFGDDWNGTIEYTVTGPSKEMLKKLQIATEDATGNQRREFGIYALTIYPFFVYIFLIISLFFYLTSRAARYIKNGHS